MDATKRRVTSIPHQEAGTGTSLERALEVPRSPLHSAVSLSRRGVTLLQLLAFARVAKINTIGVARKPYEAGEVERRPLPELVRVLSAIGFRLHLFASAGSSTIQCTGPIEYEVLAKSLQKLRYATGITTTALAAKLRTNVETIERYESPHGLKQLLSVGELARYLQGIGGSVAFFAVRRDLNLRMAVAPDSSADRPPSVVDSSRDTIDSLQRMSLTEFHKFIADQGDASFSIAPSDQRFLQRGLQRPTIESLRRHLEILQAKLEVAALFGGDAGRVVLASQECPNGVSLAQLRALTANPERSGARAAPQADVFEANKTRKTLGNGVSLSQLARTLDAMSARLELVAVHNSTRYVITLPNDRD